MKIFKPDNPHTLQHGNSKSPFDEWHDRYLKLSKSSYHWRMATFFSFTILAGSLGMNFYQASKISIVPYLIEVDTATGITNPIGKVNEIKFNPNETQIKYFLKEFVMNTRALPLDPVLYSRKFKESNFFLNKVSQQKLNAYIAQENLKEKFKNGKSVSVIINSILPVTGTPNSYQIRWEETLYDSSGSIEDRYKMSGIYTIAISPPTDESMLMINPIGMTITDFSQTQEI